MFCLGKYTKYKKYTFFRVLREIHREKVGEVTGFGYLRTLEKYNDMAKYVLLGLLILWKATWRSLAVFSVLTLILAGVRWLGVSWLEWRWVMAPIGLWMVLTAMAAVMGVLWGIGSQETFLDRLKK